jgi:hypothetical protein
VQRVYWTGWDMAWGNPVRGQTWAVKVLTEGNNSCNLEHVQSLRTQDRTSHRHMRMEAASLDVYEMLLCRVGHPRDSILRPRCCVLRRLGRPCRGSLVGCRGFSSCTFHLHRQLQSSSYREVCAGRWIL